MCRSAGPPSFPERPPTVVAPSTEATMFTSTHGRPGGAGRSSSRTTSAESMSPVGSGWIRRTRRPYLSAGRSRPLGLLWRSSRSSTTKSPTHPSIRPQETVRRLLSVAGGDRPGRNPSYRLVRFGVGTDRTTSPGSVCGLSSTWALRHRPLSTTWDLSGREPVVNGRLSPVVRTVDIQAGPPA